MLARVVLCAALILNLYSQAAEAARNKLCDIDEQRLLSRLIGYSQVLLDDKDTSETTRANIYCDNYRLLFELWLVQRLHGTPILSKGQVDAIVRSSSPFVIKNDPLRLKNFYNGNELNEAGRSIVDAQIVTHLEEVVHSKREYEARVAQFLTWTASSGSQ